MFPLCFLRLFFLRLLPFHPIEEFSLPSRMTRNFSRYKRHKWEIERKEVGPNSSNNNNNKKTQKAISWSAAGTDLNIIIIHSIWRRLGAEIWFYFFFGSCWWGDTHTHGPLVARNVIIKSNNHHHHDNGNIARRCKYNMTRRAAPDMMRRQTNAFCMIITFSIIIISLFSKEKKFYLNFDVFFLVWLDFGVDWRAMCVCSGVNNKQTSKTWIETSKCYFENITWYKKKPPLHLYSFFFSPCFCIWFWSVNHFAV